MGRPLAAPVAELLDEMASEPRPEERWWTEDDFDPRFTRTAIRRAESAKLIEVKRTDPHDWEFRFTSKGRSRQEES